MCEEGRRHRGGEVRVMVTVRVRGRVRVRVITPASIAAVYTSKALARLPC